MTKGSWKRKREMTEIEIMIKQTGYRNCKYFLQKKKLYYMKKTSVSNP